MLLLDVAVAVAHMLLRTAANKHLLLRSQVYQAGLHAHLLVHHVQHASALLTLPNLQITAGRQTCQHVKPQLLPQTAAMVLRLSTCLKYSAHPPGALGGNGSNRGQGSLLGVS